MDSCYEREARLARIGLPHADTPARERLMWIGGEVLRAMFDDLAEPKNLAKGDHWCELPWTELADLEEDEGREMREAAMDGDEREALSEAGQQLAFICMALDKGRVR